MKIGDRVVCIKSCYPTIQYRGEKLPVVGNTYTIRAIFIEPYGTGLQLVEIVNRPLPYYCPPVGTVVAECIFDINKFRLLTFGESVCETITKECEKERHYEEIKI